MIFNKTLIAAASLMLINSIAFAYTTNEDAYGNLTPTAANSGENYGYSWGKNGNPYYSFDSNSYNFTPTGDISYAAASGYSNTEYIGNTVSNYTLTFSSDQTDNAYKIIYLEGNNVSGTSVTPGVTVDASGPYTITTLYKNYAEYAILNNDSGAKMYLESNTANEATITNTNNSFLSLKNNSATGANIINSGNSSMTIEGNTVNGATISNATSGIGDTSTMTILHNNAIGATISNENSGTMNIYGNNASNSTITTGVDSTTNIGDCSAIRGCSDNATTTATNVIFNNYGKINFSGTISFSDSSLTNHGSITASNATINGGNINNTSDGTITASGNNLISSNIENEGKLTVIDGTTTISGTISGSGELIRTGSGTLITTGSNNYSGQTSVDEGTLAAGSGNTFSASSDYTISHGAAMALAGYSQTVASLNNAGTVIFHNAGDSNTGTTLNVLGDYVGNGGTIAMNTVLGVTGSTTDLLKIGGNASGTTTLAVTNAGGLGALTTNNGIELVDVAGTSTSEAFSLSGYHVDAGAYAYYLYKGDASGNGNNWYLRSQATEGNSDSSVISYRREVPMYAAAPAQLRTADETLIGDLHKRMGETHLAPDDHLSWGRIIASNSQITQNGIANASSNGHFTGLQVGSDFWRGAGWRLGAYAGYLRGDLDVAGFALGGTGAVGSMTTNTYAVGAYGTHIWNDGTYVDLVLQGSRHSVDAKPYSDRSSSMDGKGLVASAEVGKPFALGSSGWEIEPQAQVMHQWLNLEDAYLSGETTVSTRSTNGWTFRLGARLKGHYSTQWGEIEPYGRANIYHSPSGSDQLTYATSAATTTLASGAGHTSTELAAGTTLKLATNVRVFGEIGRLWSNGGDARIRSTIQGNVGIRVSW